MPQARPALRWALASLSLSMLLSSLGTSIANVGLPTLAQAFGASFQQVQWVVLAYLLAITTLVVSVGRLGDLLGRKRLLLGGIALFTLASIACGLAPSLEWLIAARAAQGLGAATMMALTMAFVGHTVPKEKTGSAMGLLGTLSAVGTALERGHFGWLNLALLLAAVMMSTLVVGPFYLAQGLGLAAPLVGLALSVGPLVVAFIGVPAGRLADRWGAEHVSLLELAVMVSGALLLALLPTSFGAAGYVAAIAVLTAGYGLFQTANNTAVMASIAADQRGLVSGLLNLARNLGLVSGASLMGAVFSLASHADDIGKAQPEALASGMRMSFAVAAVLLLIALAIAFTGRKLAARAVRGTPSLPTTMPASSM